MLMNSAFICDHNGIVPQQSDVSTRFKLYQPLFLPIDGGERGYPPTFILLHLDIV